MSDPLHALTLLAIPWSFYFLFPPTALLMGVKWSRPILSWWPPWPILAGVSAVSLPCCASKAQRQSIKGYTGRVQATNKDGYFKVPGT